MSTELTGFSTLCDQLNIPGVKSFKYAPADYIQYILPQPYNSEGRLFSFSIVWESGKTWLEGSGIYRKQDLKERQRENDQGTYFNTSIRITVPKDNPALRNEFNLMRGPRYILLLTYFDGQQLLVGDTLCPLSFSSVFESGDQLGSLKAHVLTFSGNTFAKARFLAA